MPDIEEEEVVEGITDVINPDDETVGTEEEIEEGVDVEVADEEVPEEETVIADIPDKFGGDVGKLSAAYDEAQRKITEQGEAQAALRVELEALRGKVTGNDTLPVVESTPAVPTIEDVRLSTRQDLANSRYSTDLASFEEDLILEGYNNPEERKPFIENRKNILWNKARKDAIVIEEAINKQVEHYVSTMISPIKGMLNEQVGTSLIEKEIEQIIGTDDYDGVTAADITALMKTKGFNTIEDWRNLPVDARKELTVTFGQSLAFQKMKRNGTSGAAKIPATVTPNQPVPKATTSVGNRTSSSMRLATNNQQLTTAQQKQVNDLIRSGVGREVAIEVVKEG